MAHDSPTRLGLQVALLLCAACASTRAPAVQDTADSAPPAAESKPAEASEPDVRNPGPDFGTIANSAQVVPPGRAYLETAALFARSNSPTVRTTTVPVLVRAGVARDLELRGFANVLTHRSGSGLDETWSGPLAIGAKYRLGAGAIGFFQPSFGLEVTLFLPSRTDGQDSGKLEPVLTLNADHFVSERGTLTWNLGALAPVDGAGKQFVQGFFAAAYTRSVAQDLQLFLAGDTNLPSSNAGGKSLASLGGGLFWYASQRVVLNASLNWGLTDESQDTVAVVGASFAF